MLLQMLEGRGATGSGARVIGTALTSYARNNNKGKRSRTKRFSCTDPWGFLIIMVCLF